MFGLCSGFTEIRRRAAVLLCVALLVNAMPMNAYAAEETGLPGSSVPDVSGADFVSAEPAAEENRTGVSDSDVLWEQSPASVSGADLLAEPTDGAEMTEELAEPSDGAETAEELAEPTDGAEMTEELAEPTGDVEMTEELAEPSGDAETTEELAEPSGDVEMTEELAEPSGDAETTEALEGTVSGSDLIVGAAALFAAAGKAGEHLELEVKYPDNEIYNTLSDSYNYTKEVNLGNGTMVFKLDPKLSGTTVTKPILKVYIPDCMRVTDYDNENTEFFKDYLAAGSKVSKAESGSGTVLTYEFMSGIAWVNFSITAAITNGYQLKDGTKYSIRLEYLDGSKSLGSAQSSYIVRNPSMKAGVYPDSWWDSLYLNKNTKDYYADYTRYLSNTYASHYPYDSLKMITLLPAEATPVMWDGSSYKTFTTCNIYGAKVTYKPSYAYSNKSGSIKGTAKALIYELDANASFLKGGTSCSLSGIALRFSLSPTAAGTYGKKISPRIECGVDGKSVLMSDFDNVTSEYVTFNKLPNGNVYPNESTKAGWSDILYLEENKRNYYTNEYIRKIYVTPYGEHYPYDLIRVTALLPLGAVPGFGTGDGSFSALPKGAAQNMGNFKVTYKDYSYSGKTYPALVYELASDSNAYIMKEGGTYTFQGSSGKQLHLRFVDPAVGEHTAPSLLIECIADGSVIAKYNFNDSSYTTLVTVIDLPQDTGVHSDFAHNNSVGWSDTITMVKGTNVYDTRVYDRAVFTSDDNPHYPYDWVRMTVLLPDEAVPGFGTGDDFLALEDGKTYTVASAAGPWNVTYRASYAYSDKDGNNKGVAQALIYTLLPESKARFLGEDGAFAESFTFDGSSQKLYLRFTDPTAKTYVSPGAPRVECGISGLPFVVVPYFTLTTMDTAVTFENPKVDWSKFALEGATNPTSYGQTDNWVLREAYQSDKVYYGRVKNNTGYELKNVRVQYTFDEGLDADRIELNLGDSGYPARATVTYETEQGLTATVNLTARNNRIALKGDAFLKADVVYDSLESAADAKNLLIARIHNYEGRDESVYTHPVTAEGISAGSELDENAETDPYFAAPAPASFSFGLKGTLVSLGATVGLNKTELKKGEQFQVTIYTTAGENRRYENLRLYLQMPHGYILTGYEPPAECRNGTYTASSRELENSGREVLYSLEYTDDMLYGGGAHVFTFKVGPEADTAQRQENVKMPSAVYAAVKEDGFFQFAGNVPETTIGMDVNADGDTADSFYMPTVKRVTIQPLGLMMVEGYLTSDQQVGEDTQNQYNADSRGAYRLYIYNGTGSGATVSDGILKLTLPRKDQVYQYNGSNYTSDWDAVLSAPVVVRGEFFEDADLKYSRDGVNWLKEGQIDLAEVVHIRIETAAGKLLRGTESAYVDFPFEADFTGGGLEDGRANRAYIGAHMEYSIDVSSDRTMADRLSALAAVPVEFTGIVYNDRNGNWQQDAGEETGNLYGLSLYSGAGTAGALIRDDIVTAADGSYQFGILAPGTYTLHVNKDDGAYYECNTPGYMADCAFDAEGNYTFTIGAGNSVRTSGLKLGIVKPRTLDVAPSELELDLCGSRAIVPELSPAIFSGEEPVGFASRDEAVAKADQDGIVSYAGGGETYVDVTAPQLPAVIVLGAEDGYGEYVTKAVHVTTEGLLPPVFSVFPSEPDGENGWYVSVPERLVLLSGYEGSARTVNPFWIRQAAAEEQPGDDEYHKLSEEDQPTVSGSDLYTFAAYNEAVDGAGHKFRSNRAEDAVLTLKVDVTKPGFAGGMTYRVVNTGRMEKIAHFLSFGNFFNEAVEVTVVAEDEHSGVDKLWYRLPGEEDYQPVDCRTEDGGRTGSATFRIPLDTDGQITYYVKDKAGNKSDPVYLKKDAYGAVLWVVENRGPVWSDLIPVGEDGCEGFKGADGKLWFPGPVSVSGTADDRKAEDIASSGLASVSIRINDQETESVWVSDAQERVYTYDLRTRPIEEEGQVVLRVFAEDNARNVSDAEVIFGIDLSDPVIEEVEKKLADGVPYATLRIADEGSGIDPETVRLYRGREDITDRVAVTEEDGCCTISFSIWELNFAKNEVAFAGERIFDPGALGFWVTVEDRAGRQAEKLVTPYEIDPVHVSASRGDDEHGNGTREYPFRTADKALERAVPNGTMVLLEDYRNVIGVNQTITLNLNGQEVRSEAPGSSITVGPLGKLTVVDSTGAEGYLGIEGRVFGGGLGDAAFRLQEGSQLSIAGGTIYCGCEGSGAYEVRDPARMMYLMTYRADADQTGETQYQYVQENMKTVLKENMFGRPGCVFAGWIYEGGFRQPGQSILMPGRNIVLTAKWDEIRAEARGNLDPVPKTGEQRPEGSDTARLNRMEANIKGKRKEGDGDAV